MLVRENPEKPWVPTHAFLGVFPENPQKHIKSPIFGVYLRSVFTINLISYYSHFATKLHHEPFKAIFTRLAIQSFWHNSEKGTYAFAAPK